MTKFNVGDKVRFLVYHTADGPKGEDFEVECGEVGTIIGYSERTGYYSVEVEGKPVACWGDEAWHMSEDELEAVTVH